MGINAAARYEDITNEAELDAQEQAIQQMVTNEDGIVDGQKLIEALDSLKTHFANKVKTDLENGSKFLQFLEDGQFNYAQREDSLANKIFSELATKHGNANYEYDDVTKMFHRSIFSEDGISTQSHSTVFHPSLLIASNLLFPEITSFCLLMTRF